MPSRLSVHLLWLIWVVSSVLLTGASARFLYIENGTVVNADQQSTAHVLIEDGKISAVGPDVQACAAAMPENLLSRECSNDA